MYGKRHSIIQQPPNPTLFSGPIECQIREVSLYTYVNMYTCICVAHLLKAASKLSRILEFSCSVQVFGTYVAV